MFSNSRFSLSTALIAVGAGLASAQFNSTSDRFPVPGSRYFQIGGIVFSNEFTLNSLVIDSFSSSILPPSVGSTSTSTFNLSFSFTGMPLGGSSTSFSGTGNASANIHGLSNAGGVRTFDTEMLQLNLAGGGVMIRESPTLVSPGQHSITDLGGGNFRISSFFDVFVELSLDGGQTWAPSINSAHIVGAPEPASVCGLVAGAAFLLRRRRRS